MRTSLRPALLCASLFLTVACGKDNKPNSSGSSGPISAPAGVWTWAQTKDARCGNGQGTGFAVNLEPTSQDLFIFFEGGGACYDTVTCYVAKAASYLVDGYTEQTFRNNPGELPMLNASILNNRTDPNNPFASMNWAYIPYCTGDIHAGTKTAQYTGAEEVGGDKTTYHVGGLNAGLYLQRLAATLPQVNHIWLVGDSAGGFGALLNRDRAQAAFPSARIDIIDDSGIAFSGFPEPASWGVQLPQGCTNCANDLEAIFDFYAASFPQTRIGFLSYSTDTVLPIYENITPEAYTSSLQNFVNNVAHPSNLHSFVVKGTNHATFRDFTSTSQGVSVLSWLKLLVTDDPTWQSELSF